MCFAQAADIAGTGIVAGAFYIGWIAGHPAADTLSASAQLQLRREVIRRLARYMPPFMFLPVFASVFAILKCQVSVIVTLDELGFGLSMATIAITVAVNAPLNRRFARWVPHALPHDWKIYSDRWNMAHTVRPSTATAAFICAILATR